MKKLVALLLFVTLFSCSNDEPSPIDPTVTPPPVVIPPPVVTTIPVSSL